MHKIRFLGLLGMTLMACAWAAEVSVPAVSPRYDSRCHLQAQAAQGALRLASSDEAPAVSEVPCVLAQGQCYLWVEKDSSLDEESFWSSANQLTPEWRVQFLTFAWGTGDTVPMSQTVLAQTQGKSFTQSLWVDQLLLPHQYGLVEIYLRQNVNDFKFLSQEGVSSPYNPDPSAYVLMHRFYLLRRGSEALGLHAFPQHVFLSRDHLNPPLRLTAVVYEPDTRETIPGVPVQFHYMDEAPAPSVRTNLKGEVYAHIAPYLQSFSQSVVDLLRDLDRDDVREQIWQVSAEAPGLETVHTQKLPLHFWLVPAAWRLISEFGYQMGATVSIGSAPVFPKPSLAKLPLFFASESHIQQEQVLWSMNQVFALENARASLSYSDVPGRLVVVKVADLNLRLSAVDTDKSLQISLWDDHDQIYPVYPVLPEGIGFYVPHGGHYRLSLGSKQAREVSISEHAGARSRWRGRWLLEPGAAFELDMPTW